jgi:two-component system OmpR family response regulator
MDRAQRILIVEDDPTIARITAKYLGENGFRVTTAPDGRAMDRMLASHPTDLILLDIMLPGEDGLALCRRLRGRSQVPIIMLTARTEELDRVLGLELGADDYIAKPFSSRELLARIRAVLRRGTRLHGGVEQARTGSFLFAGWRLDRGLRQLHDPAGLRVTLTGAEFQLLSVLCEHPRRALNRDQLLDLTQGRDGGPFDRSIDTLVSRIRQKIEADPKDPQIIKTVRMRGYVLAHEVSEG